MDRPQTTFVLRPLELKQLFDFAIRIYRSNFIPLFISLAIVQLPLSLMTMPLVFRLVQLTNEINMKTMTGEVPDMDFFWENFDFGVWLVVAMFGGMIYQLLVMPLGNLTCAKLATQALYGERWEFAQAFRFALTRYWPTQVALATYFLPLLILAVLVLLPVLAFNMADNTGGIITSATIALMLIMAGGFAVLLYWFRFFPALLGIVQSSEEAEGIGIFARGVWYLRRAYALTQGYFFRLFGFTLLFVMAVNFLTRGIAESTGMIVALIQAVAADENVMEGLVSYSMNSSDMISTGITLVITTLVSLLFPPVLMCFQVLLYFDLRCRKEAYDLKVVLGLEQPS